jgi:hypothetical protein
MTSKKPTVESGKEGETLKDFVKDIDDVYKNCFARKKYRPKLKPWKKKASARKLL